VIGHLAPGRVAYLENHPSILDDRAIAYEIFGVHDWVARLPVALSAVVLCCSHFA